MPLPQKSWGLCCRTFCFKVWYLLYMIHYQLRHHSIPWSQLPFMESFFISVLFHWLFKLVFFEDVSSISSFWVLIGPLHQLMIFYQSNQRILRLINNYSPLSHKSRRGINPCLLSWILCFLKCVYEDVKSSKFVLFDQNTYLTYI